VRDAEVLVLPVCEFVELPLAQALGELVPLPLPVRAAVAVVLRLAVVLSEGLSEGAADLDGSTL